MSRFFLSATLIILTFVLFQNFVDVSMSSPRRFKPSQALIEAQRSQEALNNAIGPERSKAAAIKQRQRQSKGTDKNKKQRLQSQSGKEETATVCNATDNYKRQLDAAQGTIAAIIDKSNLPFQINLGCGKIDEITQRCVTRLHERHPVCLVCQQIFTKKGTLNDDPVPFDSTKIWWKNLLLVCKPPVLDIHPLILDTYDVSSLSCVSALGGLLLSKLGVHPPPQQVENHPEEEQSNHELEVSSNRAMSPMMTKIDEVLFNDDDDLVFEVDLPMEDVSTYEPKSVDPVVALFDICHKCFQHLSRESCHGCPKAAIANYHWFGELPPMLQSKMSDGMRLLLSPYYPLMFMKTWRKAKDTGQRLVGAVSILDLGGEVAKLGLPVALHRRTDHLRILVQSGLSESDLAKIRELDCIKVSDLKEVREYLSQFHLFESLLSDAEISSLADGKDIIDLIQSVDLPQPPMHTNVANMPSESSKPSVHYRYYTKPSSSNGEDVDKFGKQILEKESKSNGATTDTIIVRPGFNFASLQEPNVLQQMFPALFMGCPLISEQRKTSLEYEFRRLMNDGSGLYSSDMLFICVAFSYTKQSQISRSIRYKSENMSESAKLAIGNLSSSEIAQSLSSAGLTKQNFVVKTAAHAVSTAFGSDGERLGMRSKIFALSQVFGMPTWFITFSPSEENNTYLHSNLTNTNRFPGAVNLHLPDRVVNLNGNFNVPTKEACLRASRENATRSVGFFHHILNVVIEDFLGWDRESGQSKPGGGMLGELEFFFAAIETNGRGILHGHMLLKIRHAPTGRFSFQQLRKDFPNDFQAQLTEYLDSTIYPSYKIKLCDAFCPCCLTKGNLRHYKAVSKAYETNQSKFLPPPTTMTCSKCTSKVTSGDVIRATAMSNLFPHAAEAKKSNSGESISEVLWTKAEVTDTVRQMLYGKTIDGIRATFNCSSNNGTYWHILLVNLFQDHNSNHTTSCFKTGSAVCRMRFPREVNACDSECEVCVSIDLDGNVTIQKQALSEWLNTSLLYGMDIFQCNQDATFLPSGSEEGVTLIIYTSKYSSKPQKPLDNKDIQMVSIAFLKKNDERLALIRDSTNEETQTNTVYGLFRSVAWHITRADEIDPQLMIWHLRYEGPFLTSHEFVRVNVSICIASAKKIAIPVLFERGGVNHSWVQSMIPSTNYRYRPASDENLPMFVFHLTRKVEYLAPVIPEHTFLDSHPYAKARRLRPCFQIPILHPSRPRINDLFSKSRYADHSKCVPGKCVAVDRESFASSVTLPQSHELNEDVDMDEKLQEQDPVLEENFDTRSFSDVDNDEDDPDLLDNASIASSCSEAFDKGNSDGDQRENWGIWIAVVFGVYRDTYQLRICPNETFWDCGNRILQTAHENAPNDEIARLILHLHNAQCELDRTKQDYSKKKQQKMEREKAAVEELRKMRESGGMVLEHEDTEDSDDLLRRTATELLDAEAIRIYAEALQDRIVGQPSMGSINFVRDQILRTWVNRGVSISDQKPNFELLYKEELFRSTTMPVPTSSGNIANATVPEIVYFSGNFSSDILEHVALEFKLMFEQRLAFFLIGAKLLCDWFPAHTFAPLPFTPTNGFYDTPLRMIVPGQGGTGKSELIKALQELARRCQKQDTIMTTAFSGVAAANVGGRTINSSGELRINSTSRKTTISDEAKRRWDPFKIIIIDEYGTCGKVLFARLDEVARVAKCNISQSFGGLNVVLMGDHIQFDPISDASLYATTNPDHRSASRMTQADVVFAEFKIVVHLFHNFRSKADPLFMRLLSNLRTNEYFHDKERTRIDLQNLNGRVLSCNPKSKTIAPPVFLVPTNAERQSMTAAAKDLLLSQPNTNIFEWTNTSEKPLSVAELKIVEEYSWQTASKIKAPPIFWAYIGMPVAITKNCTTAHQSLGVANGAFGTIVDIIFAPSCIFETDGNLRRCSEIPSSIIVKLDSHSPHQFETYDEHCRPIGPISSTGTTTFKGNRNSHTAGISIRFSYLAFPLRHRFASTYQAMQCLTSENIIMTLPKKQRGSIRKMLYMGLSRCKTYDSVRLLEALTFETLQRFRPLPHDLAVEKRLVEQSDAFFQSINAHSSLRALRTLG
jgi:hypothetical protein